MKGDYILIKKNTTYYYHEKKKDKLSYRKREHEKSILL
jgi:hypothetical protein